MAKEFTYSGFENRETCEHLRNGETCKVTGIGNSMTPILKSHQPVICEPVTDETELKKNGIIPCQFKLDGVDVPYIAEGAKVWMDKKRWSMLSGR